MVTAMETVKGTVEKIFYQRDNFSAGGLKGEKGLIRFCGKFPVHVGECLTLHGDWVEGKFGRQFEAKSREVVRDMTPDGLTYFLAQHPALKGLGEKKAAKIAEMFGDNFEDILMNAPEAMAIESGTPLEGFLQLQEEWNQDAAINKAAITLSAYGLTRHQAQTLVKTLGDGAPEILKRDPYQIVGNVRGFGFAKVDLIAKKFGMKHGALSRLMAAGKCALSDSERSGDTLLPMREWFNKTGDLAKWDEGLDHVLSALVYGEAIIKVEGPDGGEYVTLPLMHQRETFLANILKAKPNPFFNEPPPDDFAPSLNRLQRIAFQNACAAGLSLIVGSAGSGKTFTLKAIVDWYEENSMSVSLAAPTGKAAKRMEQMTGKPAKTIHRLLGFGKGPKKKDSEMLKANLVILDEVSMLDTHLAYHFFKAIDFSKTVVVLVGDHQQLPPVGPGNILRDLTNSFPNKETVPRVVFTEIVRQAGVLKTNSLAVLEGVIAPEEDQPNENEISPWSFQSEELTDTQLQESIVKFFDDGHLEKLGIDLMKDIQILTPMHKGPVGTTALNESLQRVFQRRIHGRAMPEKTKGKRLAFMVGDKIIQTRNNYEIGEGGVMNGSIGIVQSIDDENIVVDFEGEIVDIPNESEFTDDLKLAYCLTVHKAQGSEYPVTVFVCHRSHSFMHHRNLLYTAVTRARKGVVIFGSERAVKRCAQVQQVDDRRTWLGLVL